MKTMTSPTEPLELTRLARPEQLARLLLAACEPTVLADLAVDLGVPATRSLAQTRQVASQIVGVVYQSPAAARRFASRVGETVRAALDAVIAQETVDIAEQFTDIRHLAQTTLASLTDARETVRWFGRSLLEHFEQQLAEPAISQKEGTGSETLRAAIKAVLPSVYEVLSPPALVAQGKLLAITDDGTAYTVRLVVEGATQPAVADAAVSDLPTSDLQAVPAPPLQPPVERLAQPPSAAEPDILHSDTLPPDLVFGDEEKPSDLIADLALSAPALAGAIGDDQTDRPTEEKELNASADSPLPVEEVLDSIDAILTEVETVARLEPPTQPSPATELPPATEPVPLRKPVPAAPHPSPEQAGPTWPRVFHGERLVLFGGHDNLDQEYRQVIEAFGATYERHGNAVAYTDAHVEEIIARSDAIVVLQNATRDVGAMKAIARAQETGKRFFRHHSVSPRSVGAFLLQLYQEQRV